MGRWFYLIFDHLVTKDGDHLVCNEHGEEITNCCLPNWGWEDNKQFANIAPVITSTSYTFVVDTKLDMDYLRATKLSHLPFHIREIWIVKRMLEMLPIDIDQDKLYVHADFD